MPCSSKHDADILAQIPVQHALTYSDAPRPPDAEIVRSIVRIGYDHGLMIMPAFRQLKTWLARAEAERGIGGKGDKDI